VKSSAASGSKGGGGAMVNNNKVRCDKFVGFRFRSLKNLGIA
jgi:hypothetical protein